MLSLSPAKILVVLVVALIVLGPEKLPGMARQIGAAWGDLRRLRTRLESEVRDVFPDLPPAHEVARAVRSPLSFLDRLADEHERSGTEGVTGENGTAAATPVGGNGSAAAGIGSGTSPPPAAAGDALPSVPDDPSMN
ncbi:MAG: Sec-independent protein translocase subunit TatA/TatB [Acidimicrobiales bacterium]